MGYWKVLATTSPYPLALGGVIRELTAVLPENDKVVYERRLRFAILNAQEVVLVLIGQGVASPFASTWTKSKIVMNSRPAGGAAAHLERPTERGKRSPESLTSH